MSSSGKRSRWPLALLGLVGIVAVGLVHWLRFNYLADDALITLRYVRNLATGHGYVFNAGERVEGATNLLWALFLLPAAWLKLDLPTSARVLGIACAGAATGLVGLELHRRIGWGAALLAVALIALQPDFACWAGAGLESPLVALLGTFLLLRPDGPRWGLWTGLGFMTRPDGVLLGAGSVLRGIRARKGILHAVAIGGGVTLFRLAYFGRLLPNSAVAKVGFSGAQLLRGLDYVKSFALDGGMLLVVLSAVVGVVAARRDPIVQACAAWVLAQLAFCIAVGGDGLVMHRFFVPVIPALVLLGVIGGHSLLQRLASTRIGVLRAPLLRPAMGAILALPLLGTSDGGRSPATQRDVEIPQWTAVGRWLSQHTPADALVAVAPIGAVGFYSERPVLDLLGLTDAHIARVPAKLGTGRAGHERHDGKYVLDRRPAIILVGNVDVAPQRRPPRPFTWEEDIDSDPRLRSEYMVCSAPFPEGMFFNFWFRRELGTCPGNSHEASL